MEITYEMIDMWSDEYGMDIDDMLAALGEPLEDASGNAYWVFPDNNGNNLPDILESLITDPIVTNPSQGGAGSD